MVKVLYDKVVSDLVGGIEHSITEINKRIMVMRNGKSRDKIKNFKDYPALVFKLIKGPHPRSTGFLVFKHSIICHKQFQTDLACLSNTRVKPMLCYEPTMMTFGTCKLKHIYLITNKQNSPH